MDIGPNIGKMHEKHNEENIYDHDCIFCNLFFDLGCFKEKLKRFYDRDSGNKEKEIIRESIMKFIYLFHFEFQRMYSDDSGLSLKQVKEQFDCFLGSYYEDVL